MAARRPAPAPTRAATKAAARRPKRRGRRIAAWLGGLVGLGLVLGVGGFAAAYSLTDIPDPNALADAQVSTVYYSDGTTEIGDFATRNRESVTIDQVPLVVQHAVLAAEDRSFYENRGVSPTGIARAVWNNVSGGSQQGGSTITQQYVKNYFLTSERTYKRKFDEFFLSLKIDQAQSKSETLQDYLNTVYFGRNAYGIQTAAQAYFGKDVGQLNASEGALLAAVLKAPSALDPRKDPEAATQRVDYVLDGMVSEGWLSATDRAASGLPPTVEPSQEPDAYAGTDGYLLSTVRSELLSPTVGLTEDELDRGGYRIVTTFDATAQAAAVDAVAEQLPEDRPAGFQVAVSAIDPATGGVRAMYGGADFLQRSRNAVTQDTAQAGSTFKPFALVAALEDGISLRSTYSGSSPMTVKGWSTPVRNFGSESFGRINLLTATANSVNTVYAQLNAAVGPAKTEQVAVRAGYPDTTQDLADNPANVLGTAAPRPIDVTQAYATFAAQGVRNDWHTVASVDDATGARTFTASPTNQRVFSPEVMADATYAMQQVVQQGSGRYARNLGRPAAGKTGTSNGNKSAWFAGFTPQLAATVALYQIGEDGSQQTVKLGSGEVTGGSYPVRVWTAFMRAALQGQPTQAFPKPVYLGTSRGAPAATSAPTRSRTPSPSTSATSSPSETATASPTESPTASPTSSATDAPTSSPTASAATSSAPSTTQDAAQAVPTQAPDQRSASAGPTG
ncbi:transglycosylase domain-containing protein [Kineococcus rubinsiae]|uniref:transglycosylase domain-containing protein n=1 Tax=Kineococcus rubinsiae TaxID=2609562 RepID=UPI00142F612E|nr:transglycosylase domain-containing protein [Kineococcus rubinsiae]